MGDIDPGIRFQRNPSKKKRQAGFLWHTQLRQWLYDNYPLLIEEPDYLLFDLQP